MNTCLRVLKESNKSRFDCRVHIFSDNLSRNSCINNLGILVNPVIKLFRVSLWAAYQVNNK